jgi:ABC-type multidrug transport system ATPase subunit
MANTRSANNVFLQVEGLVKTHGHVTALDNLSFQVQQGEIFGFIGPDGAGKTSLFRILATLLLPDQGSVNMASLDVLKEYKKIRQIVGYMPGRFSLYHDLSVEENLKFFATVFGTSIQENYDLVRDIYSQIEPFKKRKAGALSGGMKQKLALSCALIHRPKVLILDEPTTGVDAVSRKEFWDMLKNLKKLDITIVVSTPYMDEAASCDRVALIQKGLIMQVDTPGNIIQQFEYPLLSVRSENTYRLIHDLQEYGNTHSVFPYGQSVHLSLKDKSTNKKPVMEYLASKGHENARAEMTRPTIEDCFMELMTKERKA